MSESSSSPSVTAEGSALPFDAASAVGATPADAPPAIAKDIPAAPHTGKVALERLRFEACFARAMVESPVPASKCLVASPVMLALLW
jgi:hypothetical protein